MSDVLRVLVLQGQHLVLIYTKTYIEKIQYNTITFIGKKEKLIL